MLPTGVCSATLIRRIRNHSRHQSSVLCHTVHSEGIWFLAAQLAICALPLQASTRIPRCARDDRLTSRHTARQKTTLPRLWPPFIQELQERFRRKRPRIFELAIFLAHYYFAIALGYHQRRDAFIQSGVELLYHIRILFLVVA